MNDCRILKYNLSVILLYCGNNLQSPDFNSFGFKYNFLQQKVSLFWNKLCYLSSLNHFNHWLYKFHNDLDSFKPDICHLCACFFIRNRARLMWLYWTHILKDLFLRSRRTSSVGTGSGGTRNSRCRSGNRSSTNSWLSCLACPTSSSFFSASSPPPTAPRTHWSMCSSDLTAGNNCMLTNKHAHILTRYLHRESSCLFFPPISKRLFHWDAQIWSCTWTHDDIIKWIG